MIHDALLLAGLQLISGDTPLAWVERQPQVSLGIDGISSASNRIYEKWQRFSLEQWSEPIKNGKAPVSERRILNLWRHFKLNANRERIHG